MLCFIITDLCILKERKKRLIISKIQYLNRLKFKIKATDLPIYHVHCLSSGSRWCTLRAVPATEGWHSSAQPCLVLRRAYHCSQLKPLFFCSLSPPPPPSLPPPPPLNFYFQIPSGSALSECTVRGPAQCISCLSICALQIITEK